MSTLMGPNGHAILLWLECLKCSWGLVCVSSPQFPVMLWCSAQWGWEFEALWAHLVISITLKKDKHMAALLKSLLHQV